MGDESTPQVSHRNERGHVAFYPLQMLIRDEQEQLVKPWIGALMDEYSRVVEWQMTVKPGAELLQGVLTKYISRFGKPGTLVLPSSYPADDTLLGTCQKLSIRVDQLDYANPFGICEDFFKRMHTELIAQLPGSLLSSVRSSQNFALL